MNYYSSQPLYNYIIRNNYIPILCRHVLKICVDPTRYFSKKKSTICFLVPPKRLPKNKDIQKCLNAIVSPAGIQ